MTDALSPTPHAPTGSTAGLHGGDALAALRSIGTGTLAERMGIEFVEASPQRCVATMPVEGNTQPYGLLHGGASCVLAETVGSIAAALHAGPDGAAVGVEINASHHAGVRTGRVTATATALRLGATLATYAIEIVDERGHLVCTSRLSCVIRKAPTKAQ